MSEFKNLNAEDVKRITEWYNEKGHKYLMWTLQQCLEFHDKMHGILLTVENED